MEFCHILNKFAAQLDECLSFKDFGLRQNSRASFRRKLGESAICSKYEQNSTASLSVAYLFFIIYSKSTVGQLTKLKFRMLHPYHNKYIPESSPYPQQMYINNKKRTLYHPITRSFSLSYIFIYVLGLLNIPLIHVFSTYMLDILRIHHPSLHYNMSEFHFLQYQRRLIYQPSPMSVSCQSTSVV